MSAVTNLSDRSSKTTDRLVHQMPTLLSPTKVVSRYMSSLVLTLTLSRTTLSLEQRRLRNESDHNHRPEVESRDATVVSSMFLSIEY